MNKKTTDGYKNRRGINAREKKVLAGRLAGKTFREIGEEMSTSPARVHHIAKRIEPELQMALINHSYGLDKAVEKMVEMTDAEITEFFQNKGEVTDERTVADNSTRLSARRTMLEVHGVLGRNAQLGDRDNPLEVVIRSAIERPERD